MGVIIGLVSSSVEIVVGAGCALHLVLRVTRCIDRSGIDRSSIDRWSKDRSSINRSSINRLSIDRSTRDGWISIQWYMDACPACLALTVTIDDAT
jgi:hypothetical protein